MTLSQILLILAVFLTSSILLLGFLEYLRLSEQAEEIERTRGGDAA